MINLKVDKYYELDLYEDVIMNEDKKLYQFLDNDPVKSYYFGKNIKSWKDSLNDRQVYLYSKDLRRVDINIEKYIEQELNYLIILAESNQRDQQSKENNNYISERINQLNNKFKNKRYLFY